MDAGRAKASHSDECRPAMRSKRQLAIITSLSEQSAQLHTSAQVALGDNTQRAKGWVNSCAMGRST